MNEKEIIIDSENLERIVQKLNLYIREENDIYNDISDSFDSMNDIYKASFVELEAIQNELLINVRKMITNHNQNIYMLNKRISHVYNLEKKMRELDDSTSIGEIE